MKQLSAKLAGLLSLVILLSACGTSVAPNSGTGSSMADTLTVTGYGQARGNPDMATVTVGFTITDSDISEAVTESNDTIAGITSAMKGLGVAEVDIQTTGFNVWPEDVWDPQTGQATGEKRFHVDSTMQINIRTIGDVGKVIETALTNGANSIYGLNFGIQNTDQLADEARTAALKDARMRADAIAEGLGLTVGEVSSVTDQSGGWIYPSFVGAGMGVGGGGGEPPINQGQMAVSVSLSVTYAIVR
ncbi:MAG: SIMPL domain-containing protein [Anaerolineales bacterium]